MLDQLLCPICGSNELKKRGRYQTRENGKRMLWTCQVCKKVFSETHNTGLFRVQAPISKVAAVLKVRSEGMGIRATARVFGIHKNTVSKWEKNFAALKSTLQLYLMCHEFIQLTFEADELYTRIHHNRPPSESEGWTMVVQERASRFILDSRCGVKESQMFKDVIEKVVQLQSEQLRLFSDGERRYANTLYELCWEKVHQKGRIRKVLKEGVEVALKNKGKGKPKRPKYEHPVRHHRKTEISEDSEIHGNHLEAFNASLRRRNSAFRRRTNTYAKSQESLQRTLDVHWLIHNFVRPHWTTGEVPAVALGMLDKGFSIEQALRIKRFH